MDFPAYALPFQHSYNLIEDGLAMGCAIRGDQEEVFVEFDILVMCAGEWQPHVTLPEDKVKRVVRVPYDDSKYDLPQSVLALLHKRADELAQEHRGGRKILITCLAGRNRSGLLTALVLMKRFDLSPEKAIGLIKDRRGPFALTNKIFTSYLLSLT
jgi:hypothetical protein